MMKKSNSTRKGLLKYFLIIPAILSFTLIATATGQSKAKTISAKVFLENKKIPATGASVVISGTTNGTVVDRNGEFALEVSGNPTIVISFVGYETLSLPANNINKESLIMKPSEFQISLKEKKKDSKITIRTKSDSKDEEPIYILDGEVIQDISNIDPDEIESISVIKDSNDPIFKKHKAKSGVIIIKSKQIDKKSVETKVKSDKNKEEPLFFVVEDMPSFPGGKEALKKYVNKNLVYPKEAINKGVEGDVIIQFTVTTKGELKDIKAIKSESPLLNKAAIDVFEGMPAWKCGKQRGKPVKVKVSVVVPFKLAEQ